MSNLRHSRLTIRLILGFVGVVLITTFFAAIPAYLLIQRELERQAWAQLKRGQQVTQVLLMNEQERLEDLAALTAQRPTLHRLLQQPDALNLSDYLRTLQQSVDLDLVSIRDPDGNLLTQSSDFSLTPLPGLDRTSGVHVSRTARRLILIAVEPIIDDQTGTLLGYVTVGLLMDDSFTAQLATETGFKQRFLLNDREIASSEPDVSILGTENYNANPNQGEAVFGTEPHYTLQSPLAPSDLSMTAVLETALPVTDLVAAKQRALLLIAISTVLVSTLGSGLGILLARRLTSPLEALTESAKKMSDGDLVTPIAVGQETSEIATLAYTLEESRKNTRRVLEELIQAKGWTDTLISSIVEGVVTFDTHGKVTFFSEGATRITGLSAAESMGQPLVRIFRLAESDDETFLNYIPARGEMRQVNVVTQDERLITLAITGARLAPPDSSDIQVALVLRDVTEEEAARNLRAHFLANITHEFRTPLSAISASLELLLEEVESVDVPSIHQLSSSLHLSVLNLQTLIDNLLESSSIEAGQFSVRCRAVEVNHVIRQALHVVHPLLMRRQQTLSLLEPAELSPISADPTRLGQVLVNLLSNASKYSPNNTSIDLLVENLGSDLRIAVLDRGAGIPETDRKNLFRRFMRLNSSGDEQFGIGLGLSVAKAIIEGHGGEIGVDARPGGGAIFWFKLPIGA